MTTEQHRERIRELIRALIGAVYERAICPGEAGVDARQTAAIAALDAALEPLLRDHAAWEAVRAAAQGAAIPSVSEIRCCATLQSWTVKDGQLWRWERVGWRGQPDTVGRAADPADAVLAAEEASRE